MKIKRILRWDLFDGDGGEGSGASSAEASAFMQSIGASEDANNGDRVEYGLPDEGETERPVGEDTKDQGPSLADEFAELVGKGGKYEQIFGERVSQAVQNRFKNQQDWQNIVAGYENAVAPLIQHYGLELGDIDGLSQAISEDDDLYARAADEEGITPERYRENLRLQLEAQRGRSMMEEYQAEQRQRAMFDQWDAEARTLQETFPKFDLESEITTNQRFADLLDNGVSVSDAFMATHIDDILSGSTEYTRQSTRESVAKNLTRNARRPVENGMSHGPTAVRRSDPSKLSNNDLDEILKRVEEGQTFRF